MTPTNIRLSLSVLLLGLFWAAMHFLGNVSVPHDGFAVARSASNADPRMFFIALFALFGGIVWWRPIRRKVFGHKTYRFPLGGAVAVGLLVASSAFAADPSPTPTPTPVPTMQMALAEMIQGATHTAGQAKDFLVAQTPDVVRQLLMWKAAQSVASDIMAIVAIILLMPAWKWAIKHGDDSQGASFFLAIVATVICVVVFFVNIQLDWLQIWLAPKVYLIEYAKTMLGH